MANCRLRKRKLRQLAVVGLGISSIFILVGGTMGCLPATTVANAQRPLATHEGVALPTETAGPPSESIAEKTGEALAAENPLPPAPKKTRPQLPIPDNRAQPRLIPASIDASNQQKGADMPIDTQPTGKIHHASEASFNEIVLESNLPVLVDFYADWCGPCRALAPALEQFARENPGAIVVKVNVDEAPSLAMRYGVSSIPSLMVFKSGDLRAQHVGMANQSQLQALLRR